MKPSSSNLISIGLNILLVTSLSSLPHEFITSLDFTFSCFFGYITFAHIYGVHVKFCTSINCVMIKSWYSRCSLPEYLPFPYVRYISEYLPFPYVRYISSPVFHLFGNIQCIIVNYSHSNLLSNMRTYFFYLILCLYPLTNLYSFSIALQLSHTPLPWVSIISLPTSM